MSKLAGPAALEKYLEAIEGSGKAGRVTRDDVLAYGSQKESKQVSQIRASLEFL